MLLVYCVYQFEGKSVVFDENWPLSWIVCELVACARACGSVRSRKCTQMNMNELFDFVDTKKIVCAAPNVTVFSP